MRPNRIWMYASGVAICLANALGAHAGESALEAFRFAETILRERQEYDLAEGKFEAFLQNYPQHEHAPRALYYVAFCEARRGDLATAAKHYLALSVRYPQADAALRRDSLKAGGDAWFKAGDLSRAADAYERVLKAFPEDPVAESTLFWRAMALDRLNIGARDAGDATTSREYANAAQQSFAEFLRRYPASKQAPAARRHLGLIALDLEDYTAAQTAFAALVGDDAAGATDQDGYYLGESFYRAGVFSEARKAYAGVLKNFAQGEYLDDARSGMAWCDYELAQTESDPERRATLIVSAAKGFAEAAALAGKDRDSAFRSRLDASRAFREVGDYAQAVAQLKELRKADGHPLQATAFFHHGLFRLEEAKKIRANLEQMPEGGAGATELRQRYETLMSDAIEGLRQSLNFPNLGPEAPEAATFLGEAYLDIGDYAAASSVFRDLHDRWPENERAPLALFHLALALREQDKDQAAADAVRTLMTAYPNHRLRVKAAYIIAELQAGLGQIEKSRSAYQWIADEAVAWTRKFASQDGAALGEAKRLAADARFRLGESLSTDPDRLDEAGAQYRALLKDYPESPAADMARLRLGVVLEKTGQAHDALAQYQALLKNPASPAFQPALLQTALLQLAEAQKLASGSARDKLLAGALAYLERYLQDKPVATEAAPAHHYRGEVLYARGQLEEAIQAYETALAADPEGAFADAATYGLAWCNRELGKREASREALATLVERFSDSPLHAEGQYLLGVARHEAGDTAGALAVLDDLIKRYPDSPFAPRGVIEKGKVLDKAGKPREAIALFNEFLNKNQAHPEAAWALYALSYAWWHLAEPRFAEARELEIAWRESKTPADKSAWEKALGGARAIEDNMGRVLETLIKRYGEFERIDAVWLRFGEIAYDRGNYPLALERYAKALEAATHGRSKDNAAAAQYRTAWSHLRLAEEAEKAAGEAGETEVQTLVNTAARQRATAVEAFLQLADAYPEHELAADSLFQAAELERRRGEHDKALAHYQAYLKAPETETAAPLRRAALYGQALCQLELGEAKNALAGFEAFLNAYPDGPYVANAFWGRGEAYLRLGAHADAVTWFRKALERDTAGEAAARARLGLGLVWLAEKQWAEAREEFLKVEAFHSRWPAWAALALLKSSQAAERLGQPEKARADLQRVLDRYGATPAAHLARQRMKELSQ